MHLTCPREASDTKEMSNSCKKKKAKEGKINVFWVNIVPMCLNSWFLACGTPWEGYVIFSYRQSYWRNTSLGVAFGILACSLLLLSPFSLSMWNVVHQLPKWLADTRSWCYAFPVMTDCILWVTVILPNPLIPVFLFCQDIKS